MLKGENMAYSSYSPNEERFGFSTKGSFRVGYDSERLIVLIFLIALAAILVGMIICFALCYEMLFTPVDINAAAAKDSFLASILPNTD